MKNFITTQTLEEEEQVYLEQLEQVSKKLYGVPWLRLINLCATSKINKVIFETIKETKKKNDKS